MRNIKNSMAKEELTKLLEEECELRTWDFIYIGSRIGVLSMKRQLMRLQYGKKNKISIPRKRFMGKIYISGITGNGHPDLKLRTNKVIRFERIGVLNRDYVYEVETTSGNCYYMRSSGLDKFYWEENF